MRISLVTFVALATVMAMPMGVEAQGGKPPIAPFAGAKKMTTEEALKEAPKLDKTLVPLAKAFSTAAAQLKAKPKDAAVKKAYVEAAYKYGHTMMIGQGKLPPPVQYRASLALYRKALAVDPKHKGCLEDKKMIEDIYQTMPGGVPK